MKTINEIFESNPDLLKTKEVQELVEQFKIQFELNKNKHWNYWNKVTELTMNSECFVIDGIPAKTVIKRIQDLSFA
jgi:hypothetical protein